MSTQQMARRIIALTDAILDATEDHPPHEIMIALVKATALELFAVTGGDRAKIEEGLALFCRQVREQCAEFADSLAEIGSRSS